MAKRMLATLTAEHIVVLDMADRFRDTLEVLRDSRDVAGVQDGLWAFSNLLDSTVNQHFPQEEDELFPKMLKTNPVLGGEVDALLEEHRAIGEAYMALRSELAGTSPQADSLIETGTNLINSLEDHLRREHEVMAALNK